MPLSVEWRGPKELVAALRRFREKALPYAIRNGLNTSAFETQKIWRSEVRRSFTNRNAYTERSVLVERATGTSTRAMVARVGSAAPYMAKQETGGTVTGKAGKKAIPMAAAAGLAPGSKRTKLVRARYYLGAIDVMHPKLRGDRRQRNAIQIAYALRHGSKLVLLERPKGGKGLFLLSGGKRTLRMRMLYDVSRGSVTVPAQPTLERALHAIQPKFTHIHVAAVLEQLKRFNIPGY